MLPHRIPASTCPLPHSIGRVRPEFDQLLTAGGKPSRVGGKRISLRLVTVAPWTLSVQPTCTPRVGSGAAGRLLIMLS